VKKFGKKKGCLKNSWPPELTSPGTKKGGSLGRVRIRGTQSGSSKNKGGRGEVKEEVRSGEPFAGKKSELLGMTSRN